MHSSFLGTNSLTFCVLCFLLWILTTFFRELPLDPGALCLQNAGSLYVAPVGTPSLCPGSGWLAAWSRAALASDWIHSGGVIYLPVLPTLFLGLSLTSQLAWLFPFPVLLLKLSCLPREWFLQNHLDINPYFKSAFTEPFQPQLTSGSGLNQCLINIDFVFL